MGARDIRAGRAYVEILADNSKLRAGLKKAQAMLAGFGAVVSQVGMDMAKMGAVGVTGLYALGKTFASMGDELAKASTRTGVTVENLSALKYAAEQSGSSLESLETGFRGMAKMMESARGGGADAQRTLAALGLELSDLVDLGPAQQMKLLAEQLAKIPDPSLQSAHAMAIFGRAGQDLLPLLKGGAKGIDELEAAGKRLGVTMSTADAKAAEEFGDRMDDVGKVLKAGVFNIGAALAPLLKEWTSKFIEASRAATKWIEANRELIANVGAIVLKISAFTAAGGAILLVVGKLAGGISMLTGALSFLAAHPVFATIAVATGAVIGLSYAFRSLANATGEVADAQEGRRSAGDALREADQLRLARLQQLADAEKLNSGEMKEAKGLIDDLTNRYGDLGLQLDATAGKLTGVEGAVGKVNAAMAAVATQHMAAEIREAKANVESLTKAMDYEINEAFHWSAQGRADAVAAFARQIDTAQAKIAVLTQRMRDLNAGNLKGITGKEPPTPAAAPTGKSPWTPEQLKAIEAAATAAEDLSKAESEAAKDAASSLEKEITAVQELRDQRLRLIEVILAGIAAEGGDAERVRGLQARMESIVQESESRITAMKKAALDERRKDQQAAYDEMIQADRDRSAKRGDLLADLELQAAEAAGNPERAAKLKADAYRKQMKAELDALAGPEADPALDRARQLVEGIAQGMEQTTKSMSSPASRGTFNAAAAFGLGQTSWQSKLVAATEKGNKLLEKLVDAATEGGAVLVFG